VRTTIQHKIDVASMISVALASASTMLFQTAVPIAGSQHRAIGLECQVFERRDRRHAVETLQRRHSSTKNGSTTTSAT